MPDSFLECQRDLLDLQSGVITRRQARAAGLTDKAIMSRLRSGRWQRLHRGVYATFNGEPPHLAALWAAVLRAGPQAVLSHQSAAELHGLLDVPAASIHLSVPSGSPVTCPQGIMMHYSGRLEQSRHPVLAPPRTRVEDTVLDLVETAATPDQAISLILRAVGRRRVTVDRILGCLARRPRMRWRGDVVDALRAAGEGAHSLLEFRYLTRVESPHGLPHGTRQRPVLRARRREYQDVAYEDYGLLVELDGRAAHPAEARWRDAHRDNANVADGMATIRLGYVDVSEFPCACAGVVGRALTARGWPGTLRRCGSACRLPGPER